MCYWKVNQLLCEDLTCPLCLETATLVGRMQSSSCPGMITLSALPTVGSPLEQSDRKKTEMNVLTLSAGETSWTLNDSFINTLIRLRLRRTTKTDSQWTKEKPMQLSLHSCVPNLDMIWLRHESFTVSSDWIALLIQVYGYICCILKVISPSLLADTTSELWNVSGVEGDYYCWHQCWHWRQLGVMWKVM